MGKMFSKIDRLPEFDRDFKKLLKKFKTLEEDFETFINTELNLYHKLNIDNNGIFKITGLGIETQKIFKAKKFACKSLKGKGVKSGIRIIYAYYEAIDSIEFVEIYYKGDKENEDHKRIKQKYKS
jgi:hypothetical protein